MRSMGQMFSYIGSFSFHFNTKLNFIVIIIALILSNGSVFWKRTALHAYVPRKHCAQCYHHTYVKISNVNRSSLCRYFQAFDTFKCEHHWQNSTHRNKLKKINISQVLRLQYLISCMVQILRKKFHSINKIVNAFIFQSEYYSDQMWNCYELNGFIMCSINHFQRIEKIGEGKWFDKETTSIHFYLQE